MFSKVDLCCLLRHLFSQADSCVTSHFACARVCMGGRMCNSVTGAVGAMLLSPDRDHNVYSEKKRMM